MAPKVKFGKGGGSDEGDNTDAQGLTGDTNTGNTDAISQSGVNVSNCGNGDDYSNSQIALAVIFLVILLGIFGLWWWKKRRMTAEADAKRPVKIYNYVLAILFTCVAHIATLGVYASASCGTLDDPGALVAPEWFKYIGLLFLIWTVLIPTTGTYYTLSGGNFRIIKFVYYGIFGLLVVLLISYLGVASYVQSSGDDVPQSQSDVDNYISAVRARYRLLAAIQFFWFFAALSAITLLVLSFVGMRKHGMHTGNLIWFLPAFSVSLFAYTLIDPIINTTYNLDFNWRTVSSAIAGDAFYYIFEALTYVFLLLIGTSTALGAENATYNAVFNPGSGQGPAPGTTHNTEYKGPEGPYAPAASQEPYYPPPAQNPAPSAVPDTGEGVYPSTQTQSPPPQQYTYPPPAQESHTVHHG